MGSWVGGCVRVDLSVNFVWTVAIWWERGVDRGLSGVPTFHGRVHYPRKCAVVVSEKYPNSFDLGPERFRNNCPLTDNVMNTYSAVSVSVYCTICGVCCLRRSGEIPGELPY